MRLKSQLFKLFERSVLAPTAGLRALPDFVIIGAQKGGTTSLFSALEEHPACARAWKKEVHYFDHYFDKGLNYYKRFFPLRSFMKSRGKTICGEASPYYIAHPLAAERIRSTLPDVKLIAVLRHPVDRAISHYLHNRRIGGDSREPETFAQALEYEPERIDGQVGALKGGEVAWSPGHVFHSYRTRGNYLEQLKSFEREFINGQLLVIFFEELCANPAKVLSTVFEHLEINTESAIELPRLNVGTGRQHQAIDRESVASLLAGYESKNAELFDFLGRSCPEWLRRNDELKQQYGLQFP